MHISCIMSLKTISRYSTSTAQIHPSSPFPLILPYPTHMLYYTPQAHTCYNLQIFYRGYSHMSGMSRHLWLLIGGVVILILALLISFSLYFLSTITPRKSASGTPTHVTSTHPLNQPPVSLSGAAKITRSPTPSTTPNDGIQLLQLSSDPYTNSGSQHQTEVEPGTFSHGSTIVSAFQAGRFSDIGSSNIGWATSNDGGTSWAAARTTINRASGFDGAPLVQPDGTVIVPLSNASQTTVMAFTSHDGGASWSQPTTIATVTSFSQSAYFQDKILLNAGLDSSGKVYLTWVDCRFETGCRGNDLVMTTSTDGITWTQVQRIPIAHIGSGINYYVSGLGVDTSTSGGMAHLGLVFYYYSASCVNDCKLSVGFISSISGGNSWSAKTQVAGPFPARGVARRNNKVGDDISVSFSRGRAFPVFSVATAPRASHLNEAMYTMQGGITL